MGKVQPLRKNATRIAETLRDKPLVIVQSGQYEVIGEPVRRPGLFCRHWGVKHAMGFRRIGESVKVETMPGRVVKIYPATFPHMVTELFPGDEGHTRLLKSYDAIERKERVQDAGIILPEVGGRGK